MLTSNERQTHMGLLVIRLGLAVTLLFYAFPRLISGAGAWSLVGKEMRFLDTGLSAQVVGLVILAVETLAGIGLFDRVPVSRERDFTGVGFTASIFSISSTSATKLCRCTRPPWRLSASACCSPGRAGLPWL